MYLTIRKDFFDNEDGIEYSCAVSETNDIKIHRTFDEAMIFQQKFFENFRDENHKFIINNPRINFEINESIRTEFVRILGNGIRYRTLLITTKKNYED